MHFTSPRGNDSFFNFGVFFDDGPCGPANVLTPSKDNPETVYFAKNNAGYDILVKEFTISTGTNCPISYTTWILKGYEVNETRVFMSLVERGVSLSPTDISDDLGTYLMTV